MPDPGKSTRRNKTARIPIRVLLLAAAALAMSACSLPQFAYQQAPNYIAGKLDDAFDLDEVQSAALDERLQQFFAWHREQELHQYREVLQRAARDSSDGIRAEEFLRMHDEVRAAWRRALAKAIDSVGDLAATLTPAQIANFDSYFEDRSEKYREYRAMTAQQRENYRLTRNLERLEQWLGDFDEFDRERVSERLRQLPDNYEAWLNYREARHEALIAALHDAQRSGFDAARLKTVMLSEDTAYARAFESTRRVYWQAYAEALEDISGLVDSRQRKHLISKLEDYARIVDDLASRQGRVDG